ncbi:AfsR/SARP family transcriptional regulator [Kibdelosporangium aridum]|uniref:DNA-binding transcriptional activator of the SARP family n=1 Tax=Kibdelosporangium aridum TaxID=2030 RepID=A0A1W2F9F0_KIBAR|nr:BTAD domain-containing putative transcriptional regulator [Kibdelosporangium aridum]SMD18579.1 DNA-binding transcriptional activator of the SARP family [Kibdelosporangium aridum]
MADMAFRVLGPLEVTVDGRAVSLGGRKPRMLLATLLLDPNRTVSVDTLVDVLWPGSPPRSAVANVRTYAHALRAAIGDRVRTCPGGYQITVVDDELDMTTFEAKARQGELAEASALWRGRALADLPRSPAWEPALARLEELRLSVIERSPDVPIPELRGLLAEYPLREELWRLLVRALHRDGRTSEALHAYHEAERVLANELGTRPGPGLRQARDKIRTGVFPVRQLPLDLPDFTGRTDIVTQATKALTRPPAAVVLTGAPGAGKSTLAVHIGHKVAESFPDGQLYVRLRDPADVLAYLLKAMGVPDVPASLDERAARYRSVLARREMLVVLDDAVDAAQVAPLLPGSGRSAVLITSRTWLPELHGAAHVHVDALTDAEAHDLLTKVAGAHRVNAEPARAREILRSCGNLPLAIRVAGAKLVARPSIPLRVVAERLADERGRLDELTTGSLAVRTSVTDSYLRLPTSAARAFRFAGMLGPVSFPGWTIAALLDRPNADDVLDTLVNANLLAVSVDQTGTLRYRMPDLFRCYATERLSGETRRELRAAARRVLDGYLALATHAATRMPVPFFGIVPRHGHASSSEVDATAWFDAEVPSITAILELAAELGIQRHAWRIPAMTAPYFDLRGKHAEWRRSHEIALSGVRQEDDKHGEAIVLRNQGQLALYHDRPAEAETATREALRLFAETEDDTGVGIAHAGIGTTARIRGNYQKALRHHQRALRIFMRTEKPHFEAAARIAIGTALLAQQRLPAAERWLTGARELSARIGDRHREAHALQRLAALREPAQALSHLTEATDMFQNMGDDHCVAYARQHTGELLLRAGDRTRARDLLSGSLDAHLRAGDHRSAAEVSHLLDDLEH